MFPSLTSRGPAVRTLRDEGPDSSSVWQILPVTLSGRREKTQRQAAEASRAATILTTVTLVDSVAAASTACVRTFVAAGSLDVNIRDLCEAAGISPRTFHRYFPTKPQAVRPYLVRMADAFGAVLQTAPGPLDEVARAAFAATVAIEPVEGNPLVVQLLRLLRERREYWSVFLEIVESSEADYAQTLRLRRPDWSAEKARAVAVTIVSSSRLALIAALDEGADAESVFACRLELLRGGWSDDGSRVQ